MKEIALGLDLAARLGSPLPPIPVTFFEPDEIDPKWKRVHDIVMAAKARNSSSYSAYFADMEKLSVARWQAEAEWMRLMSALGMDYDAALKFCGRLLCLLGRSGGPCDEDVITFYERALSRTDIASGHDFLVQNDRATTVLHDLIKEIERLTDALERVAPGKGTA
jgi:hypothetical protein